MNTKPFDGMQIHNLQKTCYACPAQWEALGPNGEYIYIRYRHGFFSVDINNKEAFSQELSTDDDGVMSNEKMLAVTGFVEN